MELLSRLRDLVHSVGNRFRWLPATVARLTLGWVFFQSGWGKLHNLPRVIEYFGSLGVPSPQIAAPFSASMEFLCGSLLLLGLATRVASLPLMGVMAVALWTAKRPDIESLTDLFGQEEYLYIGLLLWLGAYGGGPLSLDRLVNARLNRSGAAPDAS
jgi:putative oxidoreductase